MDQTPSISIIVNVLLVVFQIVITIVLWSNGRKGNRQNKKNDSFETRISTNEKDIAVNKNDIEHIEEKLKGIYNG